MLFVNTLCIKNNPSIVKKRTRRVFLDTINDWIKFPRRTDMSESKNKKLLIKKFAAFCAVNFFVLYLQSVQSFALLELLDLVSFCFVSVQWQSLGCFFVACLLVETDFAMFILLFLGFRLLRIVWLKMYAFIPCAARKLWYNILCAPRACKKEVLWSTSATAGTTP